MDSVGATWQGFLRRSVKGKSLVKELFRVLVSQGRALANARGASTELSRARVEREEVEIYLHELRQSRGGTRPAEQDDSAREA